MVESEAGKTYLQPVKTHDFPGMKVNINSAMLMFTIVGISIDIRSGIGVPKLILKTASLASTGPKIKLWENQIILGPR